MAPVPQPPSTAPAAPMSAREPRGAVGRDTVDGFLHQTRIRRPRSGKSRPISTKRPMSASGAGFRAAAAVARAASQGQHLGRELDQLLTAIEREYEPDLRKISQSWTIGGAFHSPSKPSTATTAVLNRSLGSDSAESSCWLPGSVVEEVDVPDALGLPDAILGAMLAGKCRDQKIGATAERQRRFAEFMLSNCAGKVFAMPDSSVGPECVKAIMLALTLCERYTGLNLSCNKLGDQGATTIGLALAKNRTLADVDLSANDISHKGVNAILESLKENGSVKSLDISSKCGALRNHLAARVNAGPMEELLLTNKSLSKLMLSATGLGADGAAGVARGLVGNSSLLVLDLSQNDIGSKGAVYMAEALKSCCLEELHLSDNRIGDEGLISLATSLGALPTSVEKQEGAKVWSGLSEALKACTKYVEAVDTVRRAILDVTLTDLQEAQHMDRNNGLSRVRDATTSLQTVVRVAEVKLPKLKVLNLANSGGTAAGVRRLEDALQINKHLEKLLLGQNDHRDSDNGTYSLIVSIPPNRTLRHLCLATCNLGTAGLMNVAKALASNQGLRTLNLSGNAVDNQAAAYLGAALGAGGNKDLRHLNMSCCHLDDAGGVKMASGLASNHGLEVLLLRDNCLHEASALALTGALERNTSLTQLSLELNTIDMRLLVKIKQLLGRNSRIREKGLPGKYRQRIQQLKGFEQEVEMLSGVLERNRLQKRRVLWKQAAKVQELTDQRETGKRRQRDAEERIEELLITQNSVEEEIRALEIKLGALRSEGTYEISQLNLRIEGVEGKIESGTKHLQSTRSQLETFEAQSSVELESVREELDRALKGQNSAALLAAAAQRNLDSFSSSLKAIGEDIAGGDNPRSRMAKVNQEEGVSKPAKDVAKTSKKTPLSRPRSGRGDRSKGK